MTVAYRDDFRAWCLDQARLLQSISNESLDIEHLADEVRCMGASEEDNLENHMIVLFEHLLKCLYQPSRRSGSWDGSIREQRKMIRKRLKKSPSLVPLIDRIASDAYEVAIIRASNQMQIPERFLPQQMPFSFEEAMENPF